MANTADTRNLTSNRLVLACLRRLDQALIDPDPESAHVTADAALCTFLSGLGYTAIVEAYEKVTPKWYA